MGGATMDTVVYCVAAAPSLPQCRTPLDFTSPSDVGTCIVHTWTLWRGGEKRGGNGGEAPIGVWLHRGVGGLDCAFSG